jgi:ligand-binding sensor domain-containing protein
MNWFKCRHLTGLLLSCLLTGNYLSAQDLDEVNFVRYTRLEGLSNNFIAGIEQDSAGYIWIATHKGMNRFDGKLFQSVYKSSAHSPLPDNQFRLIRRQSPNEIIGATRAGAFSFNPATGQNKKFIVPCDSTIFFWANNVYDIAKDTKGNYILSTKTGLYIFNDSARLINRYDHYLPADVGKLEIIFGGWVNSFDNGYTLQQNGLFGSLYDPATNRIDTLYVAKKNISQKTTDGFRRGDAHGLLW